jgi:hypothetical protein
MPVHQIYQQFPVLACVDASDGKLLWHHALKQGVQKNGPISLPAFTPAQAFICLRDSQTMSTKLTVLERDSGVRVLDDKSVSGPFTNGDPKWQRAWMSGFPHAVGSYLLVETPDGVTVWGIK